MVIEGDQTEETTIWDDLETSLTKLNNRLNRVWAAQELLAQELETLEDETCFDPIPAPCWEQRDGKGKYLRLVFPTNRKGERRREYIGADPDNIQAALDKIERSKRRHQVLAELRKIEKAARAVQADLAHAFASLHTW